MNTELMFSQRTDDWFTPKDLYNKLDQEFHFNMDPCPLRSLTDGLDKDWNGNIFVNPPYSNVAAFLEKGKVELELGHADVVVYLLASRTDVKWFHKYIYQQQGVEVRFIKGRLKFSDHKNAAPFPSMIVVFNKN